MNTGIGIAVFATAAVLFFSADVDASHRIKELRKIELSPPVAAESPAYDGQYMVAGILTPAVMNDAAPVNVHVGEFGGLMSADVEKVNGSETVLIDFNHSARGMIAQPLYTRSDFQVGTIHDIIVDRNGRMMEVIIADGGPLSVGDKKAAFNAELLNRNPKSGHYMMDIDEQTMNAMDGFSYDPTQASDSIQTLPPEGLSVNRLLNAKLVDYKGDILADIENISFDHNDRIGQLVVIYDQTLGMGGEKGAIAFSNLRLIEDRKGMRFQLTDKQSAEFSQMK